MIKPDELRSVEFDMSVLGGYKRESVDSFFDDVVRDYDNLYAENLELAKKLKVCIEKIEEYQKDERFLKAAIINAEKLNETSLREIEAREKEIEQIAKEKAENLVEKAKIEAENIVKTARLEAADSIRKCEIDAAEKIAKINAEIAVENEKLQAIKKEVSDFKDTILKLYKAHLESLSKLPEYIAESATERNAAQNKKDDSSYTFKESTDSKAEAKPEIDEENAEDSVEDNNTFEEVPKAAVHDSENEKTAEFVIDKKTASEKSNSFDEHFKFQGLKFGTDFNVESDE